MSCILFLTGCVKNELTVYKGSVVEFDAATWNANSSGLTYPMMTRVPTLNGATATSAASLTRATTSVSLRVNLVGAQRSTATTFNYVVASESTAVAGTHYTALSGTGTIPAFSSFGTVKNKTTNKILKPSLNCSGYNRYTLTHNLKNKIVSAHRIVAETFIQNPENKPTVNHKDRNRINNNLENLEWATHLEQNLHKSKSNNIRSHALNVTRICSKTNIVLEYYDSLKKASEWVIHNNLSKIKNNYYKSVMSKISAVINNKIHCNTSFGYKWSIHKTDINEDEIWKQIPIYLTKNDKNYYISNKGRLKVKNKIKNKYCKNNG